MDIHGGYSLAKPPSDIIIKDIAEVLEGELCLIVCTLDKNVCQRSIGCVSKDVWADLSLKIIEFLNNITGQNRKFL